MSKCLALLVAVLLFTSPLSGQSFFNVSASPALVPAAQGGTGSISGFIYQSDGSTPLYDAGVAADVYSTFEGITNTYSLEDGSYRITDLPPGSYRIRVNGPMPGPSFAVTYYGGATPLNPWSATPVTVTAGEETSGINVIMLPGGSIAGVVFDDQGARLNNIPVDVADGGYGACSGPNGAFTIWNLPLNTPIKIKAGGAGWPDCPGDGHLLEYWQEAASVQDATPITLTSSEPDVLDKNFTLSLGGTISGQFFESDGETPVTLDGNGIQLFDSAGNYLHQQPLNNTSSYSFDGLAAGKYIVQVIPNNRAFQYYSNALYADDATRITVTPGAVATANFSLQPGGTISGTVTSELGGPLANINIRVQGWPLGACTDSSGNYQIKGMPVGISYAVGAHTSGFCGSSNGNYLYELWSLTSTSPAPDYNEAEMIPVTAAEPDLTAINFVMVLANQITGQVVNGSGQPVANAAVSTYLPGGVRHRGTRVITGGDGRYSLNNLPPGTYWVLVEAAGYAATLYGGAPLYGSQAGAIPVTVGGGETRPDINITLAPGGMIAGMVFNYDGNTPLGNVPINVYPSSGGGICTQPDGSYFFDRLPLNTPIIIRAGGVTSRDECPDMPVVEYWQEKTDPASANPITLTAASPDRFDTHFTLDLGGTVTGVVQAASDSAPLALVNVRAEYEGGIHVDACTQDDGSFTLTDLPLDRPFKIRAGGDNWCGGLNNYALEYWQEAPDAGSATPLTLTPANPNAPPVTFTLETGGSDFCASAAGLPVSECQALVAFYYATGGPNWLVKTGWLQTNTPCTWYGVICTGGTVTHLNLGNNRLIGKLPVALTYLSNLRRLDLHNNWWQLDASANRISGSIPPQLGSLSSLQTIRLDFNQLTGSLPPEIGGLTSLQVLDLDSNYLTGSLPPQIGSLTQLRELALSGSNGIGGPLPSELFTLLNLESLNLWGRYDGPIPPEIGQLVNLRQLSLKAEFSGPIPAEIGSLTRLTALWLNQNRLSGEIPASIVNLSGLGNLDLSYNALSSSNPTVIAFLNNKQPDWAATQTMPPGNIGTSSPAVGSVSVSWTPVAYSSGDGYYEVSYALATDGSYTVAGTTPNKSVSSLDVTGLTAGEIYFFRVRTFSAAGPNNPNSLWSDYSPPVVGIPASPLNAVPGIYRYSTRQPLLTWGLVTWAAGYWVQVATDTGFTHRVYDDSTLPGNSLEVLMPSLSDGTYYWRVRAKKADSTWGAWSATARFTILASD